MCLYSSYNFSLYTLDSSSRAFVLLFLMQSALFFSPLCSNAFNSLSYSLIRDTLSRSIIKSSFVKLYSLFNSFCISSFIVSSLLSLGNIGMLPSQFLFLQQFDANIFSHLDKFIFSILLFMFNIRYLLLSVSFFSDINISVHKLSKSSFLKYGQSPTNTSITISLSIIPFSISSRLYIPKYFNSYSSFNLSNSLFSFKLLITLSFIFLNTSVSS